MLELVPHFTMESRLDVTWGEWPPRLANQSCHTRAIPCVCVVVYRVGAVRETPSPVRDSMVNLDDRDPPQRVPTGRDMGTCPHIWQEKTSRHEAWRNPIQSCHTRANPCVCVIATGRDMGTCPHIWQEKTSRHEAWRNPIQSCHTRANPCVCVIVYRVGAVLSVLCHFGSVYAHRAVRLS